MSSFTENIVIMAVPGARKGLARLLPPGWQRPEWELWDGFRYAVGSLETPTEVISVPKYFRFDGASVPLLLRFFVPMAHPDYIQAAALHDFLLWEGRHDRRACDRIFFEALGVLGMPLLWRLAMYAGVRIGGLKRWRDRLKGWTHAV